MVVNVITFCLRWEGTTILVHSRAIAIELSAGIKRMLLLIERRNDLTWIGNPRKDSRLWAIHLRGNDNTCRTHVRQDRIVLPS